MSNMIKTALTVAGSDPSGGAGIQADIKTMQALGVYGMSVITSLTAQNTMGVRGIHDVPRDFLEAQINAVFEDIFPNAVKVGMVSSAELAQVIADRLRYYGAKNIVVDPVMVSTSGSTLSKDDCIKTMEEKLFPLARLITPNIPEAERLWGKRIENREDMQKCAEYLSQKYGCAVLLKGGHFEGGADDILVYKKCEKVIWLTGERIDNPNTHGTGCTLSSAIASYLARGESLEEAVKKAKDYLTGAIRAGLDLGHGRGPLDHAYRSR